MLSPLLKHSAPPPAGFQAANPKVAAEESESGAQDFGRVFRQQEDVQVKHKASEDLNNGGTEPDISATEATSAETIDDNAPLVSSAKLDPVQLVNTQLNGVLQTVLSPAEDEVFGEDLTCEHDSRAFWLQFAGQVGLGQHLPDDITRGEAAPLAELAFLQVNPLAIDTAGEPAAPGLPNAALFLSDMTNQPLASEQWLVQTVHEDLTSRAPLILQTSVQTDVLPAVQAPLQATLQKPSSSLLSAIALQRDSGVASSAIDVASAPVEAEASGEMPAIVTVAAAVPALAAKSLTDVVTSLTSPAPVEDLSTDLVTVDAPRPPLSQDLKWLAQADQSANASALADQKSLLQLRFNQQNLAHDLVEKTGWLIEHKLDTAQIQLDPPELGPIAVKIHTHHDQVSVSFAVTNPQVRDAMEQTLQRLKDMLQDQGITLSHADVNDQRQQRDNQSDDSPSDNNNQELTDEDGAAVTLIANDQGVDQFV